MGKSAVFVRVALAWLAAVLLGPIPLLAGAPAFPSSGLDPHSLGRGGTVVAVPGTFETVLGNPATLFPTKAFTLSASFVHPEGAEGFYSLGAVDGRGGVRAGFSYLSDGATLGFTGRVWGAALAETLGGSLTIGQSFHSGRWGTTDRTFSSGDLGVALSPMGRVILGYVARGLYRSDKEAMLRRDAYGVRIALPWTLALSAEQEESAAAPGEKDFRMGLEGAPWSWLTLRGGLNRQAGAEGGSDATSYTLGATYSDQNGTIDLGMEYDPETEKMERVIFGFTMRL